MAENHTEFPTEEERLATADLRASVARSDSLKKAAILADVAKQIDAASAPVSESARAVAEVAEVVAPEPTRPAGSAGRTLPAQLADHRYRTLPKWQRDFRNPDDDMFVARYFRAIGRGDFAELQRLGDEDKLIRQARADLLEGASTAGAPFDGSAGDLLPLPVANYINIALYRKERFRQLANTTTATTGSSLRIPLQSAISTSAWGAEAVAIAAGEPAYAGNLNLELEKLATLATLSNEILRSNVFGIVGWLTNDVTMQIAQTVDGALYATGTGSGQPNGFELNDVIVTSTDTNGNIVPAGAAQIANHFLVTPINYAHLVKMFFALPEAERADAVWAGPDFVLEVLSTMLDDNGRPILNMGDAAGAIVGDSDGGGAVGSVLGRPVHNLPGAEDPTPDNSNENRLYFFNPRRSYAVLEGPGVMVEASRDFLFSTDMTAYRFIRHIDGGVIGNTIGTTATRSYVFSGGISGAGTPTA